MLDIAGPVQAGATAWLLSGGFLLLVMQAGFALLTCGSAQRKNAAHVVMLNLTAFIVTFLAYYVSGYAFEFGGLATPGLTTPVLGTFLIGRGAWGVLGGRGFLLSGPSYNATTAAMVLVRGAVLAVTGFIIAGAVCERIRFWAFVVGVAFVGALLGPAIGCWVWGGGWLSQIGATMHLGHGYVDVAGSMVIHGVGGFAAMAVAIVLGPRIGKFGRRGESRAFPAHNVVYVVVGTLLLLAGWMGFAVGSAFGIGEISVGIVAVNTNLAAASGSAAAMLVWYMAYGVPDISMACSGLLAGLVAIAAPGPFVGPTAAVIIGILAGLLASGGVLFNDRVLKIDDPCGAIAVHGYCGWFGAVALGLFANGSFGAGWNGIGPVSYLGKAGRGVTGLFYGDPSQFVAQVAGATVCALVAFSATYVVLKAANAIRPIRIPREIELEGLDLPEFGTLAYPDEGSSIS